MFEEQQAAPALSRRPALAELVIVALAFLVPIFTIPVLGVPFQFSKVVLALVAVALLLLFFSVRTLRTGVFSIAWSPLLWGMLVLPVGYAVSTIFSSNLAASLFGYQLDADTLGFVLLGVGLSLMVFYSIQNVRTIFYAFLGFLAAGLIAFLFQLIQVFFGAPFSFMGFTSLTDNLIGKWNDFGLFAGLIGSLSLIALTSLALGMRQKVVLWITLALSVFFLVLVNFLLAWILIGIVSFVLLVYWLTRRFMLGERHDHGVAALVIFVFTLFFMLAGSGLSTALQGAVGLQALEVRPSVQSTILVGKAVYAQNAIFGSGPNTFAMDWLQNRPADIIATPFWNANFPAGFGSIPTSVITGGLVVGLAWIAFIALFLYVLVRALLTVPADGSRAYMLVVASALSSAYLLAAHVFYVASQSLTILLFLSLGLFLASLRGSRLAREITVSFVERPRIGFVSALAIVLILTGSLVSLYGAGRLYASTVIHQRLVQSPLPDSIATAVSSVSSALSLSPQDTYYRTLAVLQIAQLRQIVASGKSDTATQQAFRDTFTQAVDAATKAVTANPKGYENLLVLGGVYQEVVPLGIDGAYDNAVAAYERARLLNPTSPEIDFHIAEMKSVKGDASGARTSVEAALAKKADYTPAILLLAQLSLNAGKLTDAIAAVEAAVFLNPSNEQLVYQLGLLYLQNKGYDKAAAAFEKALSLNSSYANASFFLGESYVFLNRSADALVQFKDLEAKNPDNQPLKDIITALGKGTNPFIPDNKKLPPGDTSSVQ